jgi:hypothetical protein
MRETWQGVALCAVLLIGLTVPAQAYIDPGMGNLVLQGMLGSLAVVMLAVRRFWGRIRAVACRVVSRIARIP